mmetsp:Transcript_5431/g.9886  ORF Transcript_5431/g.9886 Transcript_5431/m.9886 type:complete len:127 (+) Transcript_5431:121-501(+)|eukprot:CAMPEP_0183703822 /NCGR_PEP_ID=MMETSP0737-20130205/1411_1 /TAXON_ID=385413 /ORGANISM="Thalassiosira miniscula, Strain CCMP1093" /LENGTH=126 /DNA_ID=CAMNT_0025930619 /DNA_START=139 /DNA_END=519 /DNA_ORIENTATION=-
MMNHSALLLYSAIVGLLSTMSSAFAPTQTSHRSSIAITGPLHSITFEPPPEDNCELDGTNCEESIFDRKKRERTEADNAIVDRYRMERGIEISEADLYESVDQYSNAPTGGNLIPGISLTALCEDD